MSDIPNDDDDDIPINTYVSSKIKFFENLSKKNTDTINKILTDTKTDSDSESSTDSDTDSDSESESESDTGINTLHLNITNIYNDNDTDTVYRCDSCGQLYTLNAYTSFHICSNVLNLNIDNIPTNIFGKYECLVCNKKYTTQGLLGEHFMLSHDNYQDLLVLDEHTKRYGFPGFDILEEMGMINILTKKQTKYFIKTEKKCTLCYYPYKYKSEMVTYIESSVYDKSNYYSDSDLHYHYQTLMRLDNNYYEEYTPNLLIPITDPELLDNYRKYSDTERLPTTLVCCNTDVCYNCLENVLLSTDSVTCPFCKCDHTKTDLKYITVVDLSDDVDARKWDNWWLKHLDLLAKIYDIDSSNSM